MRTIRAFALACLAATSLAADPARSDAPAARESEEQATKLLEQALKLQREGKSEQALTAAERALELATKVEADPLLIAMIAHVMGSSFDSLGRFEPAEAAYKNSIAFAEKSGGHEDSHVARSLGALADLYLTRDRVAEAVPLLVRAISIQEKSSGKKSASYARDLSNLGIVYANHGRRAKAEEYLRRAVSAFEQAAGAGAPDTAAVRKDLEALAKQNSAERGQPTAPASYQEAVLHLKAFTTTPQLMERACAVAQPEYAAANAAALANWKAVNADLLLEIDQRFGKLMPESKEPAHEPKAGREVCGMLARGLADGSFDAELLYPAHVATLANGK